MTIVDTALAYTGAPDYSTAERFVGRAAREIGRDRLFVSTKGGHWRNGNEFPIDGRPETLVRHCESSLRELGIDEIDLYYLHHVDPAIPLEESVEALGVLQRAGKIRHIGLSNVTRTQLAEAVRIATVSAVQNRFSLTSPEDLPMVRHCADAAIAYFAYMPLGGRGANRPAAVDRIAGRRGVSAAQVLLAWTRAQGASVVPIFGASRPASARDSAAAAHLHLSDDDLATLAGTHPPFLPPKTKFIKPPC